MINIPEEIKNLLHTEGINKNIRIHFPNGERADICNDMIIKDSVTLTESLCSQDTLKFGLCESPVFECSVVGCENVKGATIEVSCEIYCPQTVDGAEFKPDIQAYVYPIPYGTFVISECKRDADMQYRKIVAYCQTSGKLWAKDKDSYADFYMRSESVATLTVPLEQLIFNGSKNMFNIADEEWTEVTAVEGVTSHNDRTFYGEGNTYRIVTTTVGMYCPSPPSNRAVRCFPEYIIKDGAKSELDAFIEYLRTEGGGETLEEHLMEDYANQVYFSAFPYYGAPGDQRIKNPVYFVKNSNEIFFSQPELTGTYSPDYYTDYWVYINGTSGGTKRIYWHNLNEFKIAYSNGEYTSTPFTFKGTLIEGTDNYSYYDDYLNTDLQKLYSDAIALRGKFAVYTRKGVSLKSIKQMFAQTPSSELYPGSSTLPQGATGGKLLPNDYQKCWYDDEYTKPFGKISVSYKNTDDEDVVYEYYLTGYDETSDGSSYQTYDLSSNEIIKASTWTQAQIDDICDTIAENIEGVTYMPVEFTGRGLPYVEAGDTFEILTKNNDSITTIVLNRTLSGEQVLTDNYKSN